MLGSSTKAIAEIDALMNSQLLNDEARHQLANIRAEVQSAASPTFHRMTPMNVSLSLALLNSEDMEASRWLAQTFASSKYSSPQIGSKDPPLFQPMDGMPKLDLATSTLPPLRFSRPPCRRTKVFATPDELQATFTAINESFFETLVYIPNVGSDDCNVRQLLYALGQDERKLFLSVCASISAQYSLFHTLRLDLPRYAAFLSAVYESMSSRDNSFHNAVRAADVVQLIHAFLSQEHVGENLADIEIIATIVAAMGMDAGHCGVSNDFLSRIRHTLTTIFGDRAPMEHAALAFVNGLLDREEYNFFSTCESWLDNSETPYLFGRIVTEVILGSAPESHDALIGRLRATLCQGTIGDDDIPYILAAVTHAADYGFLLKPRSEHIDWVTLLLSENIRQGAEEERRRLAVSPLCGADAGEHVSAAILGLLRCVLEPLFESLSTLLPPSWTASLQRVKAMYQIASNTSGKEDDEHATSPPILFEADDLPPWCDIIHPSLASLRRLVGAAAPTLDRKASQHAILHATPQRQLSVSSFSESMNQKSAGPSNRTEHYYTFLKMFEAFDREGKTFGDFGGNIVFLASQLDPLYLGDYAGSVPRGDMCSADSCIRVADLIVDTEQPPTSAEVIASPTKRSRGTTDSFLLQLLHMYRRRNGSAPGRAQASTNGNANVYHTPLGSGHYGAAGGSYDDGRQLRRRIQSENPIYSAQR